MSKYRTALGNIYAECLLHAGPGSDFGKNEQETIRIIMSEIEETLWGKAPTIDQVLKILLYAAWDRPGGAWQAFEMIGEEWQHTDDPSMYGPDAAELAYLTGVFKKHNMPVPYLLSQKREWST